MYVYKRSRQDTDGVHRKPRKEYTCPCLERINGSFYFIGPKVYRLNQKEPGNFLVDYAEVLSDAEVSNLPVSIKYIGPHLEFSCDERGFIECYGKILREFNLMQDPRYVSFPLGL